METPKLRYRRRSEVFEAQRWFRPGDCRHVEPYRTTADYRCPKCSCHIEEHGQLPIGNKRQLVCPGDFIVPSTCGDLYPVDPETFWQLYELVE